MKMHISDKGPERCHKDPAKNSTCPFAGEDDHFNTKPEALAEWNKRQAQGQEKINTLKSQKEKLSKKESEIRDMHAELAKKIVDIRAESISGIAYEDANPERAKKRLSEAIEYARSRENSHLVEKLSTATVLPSGAFKLDDGSRANLDQLLKAKETVRHVEEQRELALASLSKMAQEAALSGNAGKLDKFSHKTAAGSFSMSVKEGFDEAAFEALPKATQSKLMSEKSSLNIDLAREHLTAAQLRDVTRESQVLDFVIGKSKDVGQATNTIPEATGNTVDEKLQNGLENIAGFYGKVAEDQGKVRDLKASVTESADAIKKAASKTGNTFVPARSQYNGAIVSGRQNLDPKKVAELLTPEQIAKISVKNLAPDEAKASSILNAEDYAKVYKAKKVSIRVTEAK